MNWLYCPFDICHVYTSPSRSFLTRVSNGNFKILGNRFKDNMLLVCMFVSLWYQMFQLQVEEAEILAAELAGEEADPQLKIDILKKEELLCEEERVEEEIIKEEDMKRKESMDTTEVC